MGLAEVYLQMTSHATSVNMTILTKRHLDQKCFWSEWIINRFRKKLTRTPWSMPWHHHDEMSSTTSSLNIPYINLTFLVASMIECKECNLPSSCLYSSPVAIAQTHHTIIRICHYTIFKSPIPRDTSITNQQISRRTNHQNARRRQRQPSVQLELAPGHLIRRRPIQPAHARRRLLEVPSTIPNPERRRIRAREVGGDVSLRECAIPDQAGASVGGKVLPLSSLSGSPRYVPRLKRLNEPNANNILPAAPFQWCAIFRKTDIRFKKGTDSLMFYSSHEKSKEYQVPTKVYCSNCNSPIMDEGRNMCLIFPELIDLGQTEEEHLVRRKVFEIECVLSFPLYLLSVWTLILTGQLEVAIYFIAGDSWKYTMESRSGLSWMKRVIGWMMMGISCNSRTYGRR